MIYIFDLDGTLSDLTQRLHHIQKEPKDWDGFFASCKNDSPIIQTINVAKALRRAGHYIWIVSGRSDAVRSDTIDWLYRYCVQHDELIMRKAGDRRHDTEVKKEWFLSLPEVDKNNIAGVFEDRANVVEMWRSLGLICYQVADGKF